MAKKTDKKGKVGKTTFGVRRKGKAKKRTGPKEAPTKKYNRQGR
jgi:hypothetical protein